jgi:hypothetical protein
MTRTEVCALTEAIGAWVQSRPDLRALGLVGSWARGDGRPDSDLDMLLLADRPEVYRSNHDWLDRLRLPAPFRVSSHADASYGAVWSCHVALEPDAKLELTFGALDWASTNPIDSGTRSVVLGGLRTIVDKDGRLRRLVEAVGL